MTSLSECRMLKSLSPLTPLLPLIFLNDCRESESCNRERTDGLGRQLEQTARAEVVYGSIAFNNLEGYGYHLNLTGNLYLPEQQHKGIPPISFVVRMKM